MPTCNSSTPILPIRLISFPPATTRQLVAGYSKNTPAKGLKTYMPDFDELKKP